VAVPAEVQMVVFAGGEAGVVEDERGLVGTRFEFEVDDGVDAGVPVGGAPGLDDSRIGAAVGDELNVAASDEAAEHPQGAAGSGVDGGGEAREGGKLFLIEDSFIKALRAGVEFDFVMNRGAGRVEAGGGLLLHLRLLSMQAGEGDGGEGRGNCCEDAAACGDGRGWGGVHRDLRKSFK